MYFLVGCLFAAMAGSVEPVEAIIFAEVLNVFTIEDRDEQNYLAVLYGGCFVALGTGAFLAYTLEVSHPIC